MSNIAIWNVRLRHQWLATPMKKARCKKRSAVRVGLKDAWDRNKPKEKAEAAPAEAAPEAQQPSES
jgi:hypothetical protein